VFLAADQERPSRLAEAQLGVAETQFSYALGRLALWSNDPAALEALGIELLRGGTFRRLAIANPAVAPYGVAAEETLIALDVWQDVQPLLVRGENIGQTFSIVFTGNADLGLVALAQAIDYPAENYIEVPADLHRPIRQDAILLARARENPAAVEFVQFLAGDAAIELIRELGYETP
jgi:molybdate transport system substrate-binding protein